jgi:hypothetical protein
MNLKSEEIKKIDLKTRIDRDTFATNDDEIEKK